MNRIFIVRIAYFTIFIGFLTVLNKKYPDLLFKTNSHSASTGLPSMQNQNEGKTTRSHSKGKKQRRMGVFHYNEGNRFFEKENWLKAAQNYEMALKHDRTIKEVYINLSTAYLKHHNFQNALKTLEDLKKSQPKYPILHYNFACYHSLTGNIEPALNSLMYAVKLGFKDKGLILTDPDLANLRSEVPFQKWIKKLTF